MKIGILTQPLHNNYGGLLQNYALQKVLTEKGHDVLTINVQNTKYSSPLFRSASILKRTILKLTGKEIVIRSWATKKENSIISCFTSQFIKDNIKTTEEFGSKITEKLLHKYSFDAYIVGSDQVWRPRYSPQLSSYFLDFLENNCRVKKIAYAASFGVDNIEFKNKQIKKFSRLLKLFDGISVREDTAIELCMKNLGVKAIHLLDPTMLLNLDAYYEIIEKDKLDKSPGNLFTYILDMDENKRRLIEYIKKNNNLKTFSVLPQKKISQPGKKDITEYIYPPVSKWLKGFVDAEFVITDSFHGTVFSILYNKPFIAINNVERGSSRFESLLKKFNLEYRFISNMSEENIHKAINNEINWDYINNIIHQERLKSLDFLNSKL